MFLGSCQKLNFVLDQDNTDDHFENYIKIMKIYQNLNGIWTQKKGLKVLFQQYKLEDINYMNTHSGPGFSEGMLYNQGAEDDTSFE